MKLSVIVPCFNESATILALLDAVRAAPWPDKEIIVVDDCSTDGTRELLAAMQPPPFDRLLLHERNQGKGAALRTGFAHATGDAVIVQDADLETDPNDYPRLLAPIVAGDADVVFGTRFGASPSRQVVRFWRRFFNGALTLLSNMLSNLNLSDMETCYKVFRREVIQAITIEENRFGFEPEITAKVARMGCRIHEVSITYRGRTHAEGKKIGWKDGVRAVYCIFKYNWFGSRRGHGR